MTWCRDQDRWKNHKRLAASRRAHRARLTKVTKKISELQDGEIHDAQTTAALDCCLKQFQRKKQVLTELGNKIFGLSEDPADLGKEILEAEDIQSLIAKKICSTKSLIESPNNPNPNEVYHGQPGIQSNATQVNS